MVHSEIHVFTLGSLSESFRNEILMFQNLQLTESKGDLSSFAESTALIRSTEFLIVKLIGYLSDNGFGLDEIMFLYLIDGSLKKTNQFYLFLNGSPS